MRIPFRLRLAALAMTLPLLSPSFTAHAKPAAATPTAPAPQHARFHLALGTSGLDLSFEHDRER